MTQTGFGRPASLEYVIQSCTEALAAMPTTFEEYDATLERFVLEYVFNAEYLQEKRHSI